MLRRGKIVIVAVALTVVLVGAVFAYAALQGPQDDSSESSALPVVTVGQSVPGALNEEIPAFPRPNTTDIWTVVIGDVDAEEPFGAYKAALIHNGQVLIGPETLKPGRLGQNGNYQLFFFEATPNGGCSHNPCDGLLSEGDYLEFHFAEPGEMYVVQVLWGATGEVLVEVPVYT